MRTARITTISLIIILVATATVMLAQGDTTPTDSAALRVTNAWARPGDGMSAAYLRITNDGDRNEQLIAVRTDVAMAELHESQMHGDMMQMRRVEIIDIPAGHSAALEPGGLHIMLMHLRRPLIEGDTLPLTLVFASGVELDVTARVSHTPVPLALERDALTDEALAATAQGVYVGQVVDPPLMVQDFIAPGSDAHLTRLSDTGGTWRVIFFGYMHCPDFCPLTLVDYRRTAELLGDDGENVTFMFISVDSARDTPEALRAYLNNFDPAFVGFAPDDATLAAIQPDYGFYYERRMDRGSLAVYTIDHSTRSYLVDPDGVLRASFAYQTRPQQIADALRWYMAHQTH